jgi:SAM-dependent methyltransferase
MSDPAFTGERFVPGQGGFQIAYEHLHRYLFASRWAMDGVILDVATGLGYGAELLAKVAQTVVAVDLDGPTIALARSISQASNVRFLQADAGHLPFRAGHFSLVLAMEVLEHVADPEGMVREIARVAHPRGLVMISTPNRATYSDARQYANPYHVREFYREEFLGLLAKHFARVELLGQQVRAGSHIETRAPRVGAEGEIFTDPLPDPQRLPKPPQYFLALCGVESWGASLPGASVYVDLSDGYIDEWNQRLTLANSEIARVNKIIDEMGRWSKAQDQALTQRDTTIRHLQNEINQRQQAICRMQEEITIRDEALLQLRMEFEDRSRWALSLQDDVAERDKRLREAMDLLDRTDAELKQVEAHLSRIRHAFLYRVLCRLGVLPK